MAYGEMNNFLTPGMHGPLSPAVNTGAFDMNYVGKRGATRARLAGMGAQLNSTAMGRALKMGTMESFGWHFEGGASQGFLGLRSDMSGSRISNAISGAKQGGQNRFLAGMKAAGRQSRALGAGGTARAVAGVGGRALTKSLGLLSTAYFAYEGYEKEGVWGAMKGVGESIAYSTAFNYVLGSVGASALAYAAPVAAVAAAAGATYMLGEAGIAHAKGLRDLEMGGGDLMQQTVTSAGAATARQRSLMALNNTHINGRMAIGNEGFLMHRGFSA